MTVYYYVFAAAIFEVFRHYLFIEVWNIDLEKNDKSWRYPNHRYVFAERLIFLVFLIIKFGALSALHIPLMWALFQYGLNISRPGIKLKHVGRDGPGWEFDDLLRTIDQKIGPTARIITHITISILISCSSLIIEGKIKL